MKIRNAVHELPIFKKNSIFEYEKSSIFEF